MGLLHTDYDASSKTWSGIRVPPLYNPNVSAGALILNGLARNPEHVGQISDCSGARWTNRQLRDAAVRLAINLRRLLGIRRNDVIAFIAKNHEPVTSLIIAGLALGAPISTMDPSFKVDEIAHIMSITQPKFLFCDSDSIVESRKALQQLDLQSIPVITIDKRVEGARYIGEFLDPCENEDLFVPVHLEDGTKQVAFILCTSGTTGKSKGVAVSHAQIIMGSSLTFSIIAGDVYFSFSSLYWGSGVFGLIGSALEGITRIITTKPFDVPLMLDIIERYGVSITMGAPSNLAQLLNCPKIHQTNLSSMRQYFSVGGLTAMDLVDKINALLPSHIRIAYGMSELGSMVSSTTPKSERPLSVGTLNQNVIVRILDDDKNRCGPLINGEICIRHSCPLLGYWNDAAATANAIDEEGFIHSGDIGHFDEDGFLYIVDRKREMLKYYGYQLAPSDLENVLSQYDGVVEVCVVGIADAEAGDLPAAAIVRRQTGHRITEDEILTIVKDKLSDAKQLRGGVYFLDSLPMTPSGKVRRRDVKETLNKLYQEKYQNNQL